ncbi:unnamed protein product [Acanthoscelides obtectus]|uniref:Uncharacterized protein n=1 Tax=Acanthoscelides obtectus TaxID=200917 RepID=A0A9P0PSA0_ACAOB|nr:unnamed protein product [Acanthoscelides obtectus]CAK1653624.1 hypothetical protein AOBTE_LOCUS18308 [Acanthoscelides obtectus]
MELNYFAIQLDELTDVANCAYVLFAKLQETYMTGAANFNPISDYFEKHENNWSFCLGVCTDG